MLGLPGVKGTLAGADTVFGQFCLWEEASRVLAQGLGSYPGLSLITVPLFG